jgi:hypothetical protein
MDLKLEDLCVVCPRCNGQRNIETVEGVGNAGMPGPGATRWFGQCQECAGSGTKLTALGEVFAQFAGRLKAMGRI